MATPLRLMRDRLVTNNAILSLSILGILTGLLAATLIVIFRHALEWPARAWMPAGIAENFEALPDIWRFGAPLIGGLLLGSCYLFIDRSRQSVGLAHVIHVCNNLHGAVPAKNAVVQFFAGLLALLSGQSGGREGPAVHLGAAISSKITEVLRLPHNSARVLISCGTAAAIAASFNTPIAGVIFAMEVVMLEYTIAGFTPVILAAIVATIVSRASFGAEPAFLIELINMSTTAEVFLVTGLGLACGALAALFVLVQRLCLRWSDKPALLRLGLAGFLTGLVALPVPEVLGLGYDTLQSMLSDSLPLQFLLIFIVSKLLISAIACGLGMPLGFIGPALIVGAATGSFVGQSAEGWMALNSDPQFFVLLGMGALMGAILNAPLAALLAIVELTHNPQIMLPGMLAIITATLTSGGLFRQISAQEATLKSQGFQINNDPLSQALQRASVVSLMDRDYRRTEQILSRNHAEALCKYRPRWLLYMHSTDGLQLLETTDLILHLEEQRPEESDPDTQSGDQAVDLSKVAGKQRSTANIQPEATLKEALELLNVEAVNALYISGPAVAFYVPPRGIITRDHIENYYRNPQSH